jgi:hypothetical protein
MIGSSIRIDGGPMIIVGQRYLPKISESVLWPRNSLVVPRLESVASSEDRSHAPVCGSLRAHRKIDQFVEFLRLNCCGKNIVAGATVDVMAKYLNNDMALIPESSVNQK